jgi:hypothetical protein
MRNQSTSQHDMATLEDGRSSDMPIETVIRILGVSKWAKAKAMAVRALCRGLASRYGLLPVVCSQVLQQCI